jgi:beta-glucanase (GH16 family)
MYMYLKFYTLTFLLFVALGCGGDGNEDEKIVLAPENLQVVVDVKGASAENLEGDGSGEVTFKATADNATSFKLKFEGNEKVMTNGQRTITFVLPGTKIYLVKITAIGSEGKSTSENINVEVEREYDTPVWEDNFDADGAPDDLNWTYDIGTGSNGWGNNEAQYYTDRTENVEAKDGVLSIKAKKEDYNGSSYTSTRMKTQGKFDFTYGRVDVKAILPSGGGCWPAIWMLGSNIGTVNWPACGEIDIMEYTSNAPGKISSAIHNSSSSGNTVNVKAVAIENETEEFHLYTMIWSEDKIYFLLDEELYYTYNPVVKNNDTWPFNADQFLILNVAMGGTLGGSIDPGFTESEMKIDYVRVYE